ncbi:MAG: hypothetical protein ABEK75_05595 [Salinibacter sp.]
MPRPRPMLIGSTCALGLLCLLLGACRTNGPDTTTSGPDTTRPDATADTAAAPSDASVDPTAPPPAPAPGTARVRAEIRSCTTEGQPARCRIRVDEVLAYGSSTPPLPTGDHTVRLSPSVLNDRDAATLDGTGPRPITLRHAGDRPDLGGDDADENRPAWTLQSMEHGE